MQALCYAIEYPDFADVVIPLLQLHIRDHGRLFNKVAMEAIRNDPEFKEGLMIQKIFKKKGLKGLGVGEWQGISLIWLVGLWIRSLEASYATRWFI